MVRLTVARVKSLRKPGRYGDGNGLYLNIANGGSKSWVQRLVIYGNRRDMGLGGYPDVSLAQARWRAAENSAKVADGSNPFEERRSVAPPSFKEAALTVHRINARTWSNKRHIDAWLTTLERYAFPVIGGMPIHTIKKTDVLSVLTPIWTGKPETARRVRQRMGKVFRWAMRLLGFQSGRRGHKRSPSQDSKSKGTPSRTPLSQVQGCGGPHS